MKKPLDSVSVQRLAFVRHLYLLGLRQSRQPEPLRALAVLMFHDAVELFLDLAVGVERPKGNQTFEWYLITLKNRLPGQSIPEHDGLTRLNRGRATLKHYGQTPANVDIEGHRATVTSFFETATPLLFDGLNFRAVSLCDLVSAAAAREAIREGEGLAAAGDLLGGLNRLVFGLQAAMGDFDARRTNEFGPDPFLVGERMSTVRKTLEHAGSWGGPEDLHGALTAITDTTDQLQRTVRLLSMGVDLRKYFRFLSLVKRAIEASHPGLFPNRQPATPEHFEYCRDFVVETALAFQQFDDALEVR